MKIRQVFKPAAMFKRSIFIAMLIITSLVINAHDTDTVHAGLPGNWLLVKHMITDGGKTTNELAPELQYSYHFNTKGDYTVVYTNTKTGITTTYAGKWKLLHGNKTLKLYDNRLPAEPKQLVADQSLPVIKLTSKEFVTRELLFAMDMKGTSYYRRQ